MMMVKELEPHLPDGTVTWGGNLNVISFPHFRVTTCEESMMAGRQNSSSSSARQVDRKEHKKKKKKVKTSSTQTDVQSQSASSRPGVRYMDTTPSKELFDSFSSLSPLDHSMEQQSQADQHNEQTTNIIESLTMQTTKKHLVGKNLQHSDKKRHRSKKEKFKMNEDDTRNTSMSNSTSGTMTHSASPPVSDGKHCTTAQLASPVTTQQEHLSLASTPYIDAMTHHTQKLSHPSDIMTHHTQVQPHSSDILTHHTQVQPHSSDIVTHHTQVQPHSSDIMTHHTQIQPHSSDIVTHHTQMQPHSSDIVTHHTQVQPHSSDAMTHRTQVQPHSSDIVTHHTQIQPHSSDIMTHRTQVQAHIMEQVKHWSKFEQLKAKYLPHSYVSSSDNQRILHSRFLAKQKLT